MLEATVNSSLCGCEMFGAAGRRQCIQNCLTASCRLAPSEPPTRDRTRKPLHASTQNSSLPPQPLLAAAFEPGRTFSTTSARRQQQQSRQNQRPERYLRQHAFETLAHDRTRNPLHASTQNSSLPPQPLLAAAFQAGRTFSTLPTRRQQQQTCQNFCPNGTCASTRLRRSRTTSHPKCFTPARTALGCCLWHCCRQLVSRPKRSAHRLHAHSSRETAPQRVG